MGEKQGECITCPHEQRVRSSQLDPGSLEANDECRSGVMFCPIEWVTADGYDMQFMTNVLGKFVSLPLSQSDVARRPFLPHEAPDAGHPRGQGNASRPSFPHHHGILFRFTPVR